uniref:Free fatty acid receptor 4 n=1 Tax=Acanthochromis polyacanthus TaxID=80966 RepID=A0A3Q1GUV1_9TELE
LPGTTLSLFRLCASHSCIQSPEALEKNKKWLEYDQQREACLRAILARRRPLANKTILTLNLFVADLLFVSMIPLIVSVRWTVSWTLGDKACKTVLYVICMGGCATVTTLASISVERVQAILRLQTMHTLSPRMKRGHICTLKWPDETGEIVWDVSFTALCFLLPGLIIGTSYSKILQIAKSCRERFRPRDSQPTVGDVPDYRISRQDMKLFRTILVLVLSFLIMWSPIFIITFLILARNYLGQIHVSSTMFFWVVTFTLANSALNPILYSVCQFKSSCEELCFYKKSNHCGLFDMPS